MIEPPSTRLQQRLTALKLCRRCDLRRCRRRVRQLARDLPAFDSVWIDALLQERKLTPFQARLLESPYPERLSVGPCVLVDQLGAGPGGETYLARLGDGKQRCVLKLVSGGVLDGGAVNGHGNTDGERAGESGTQYSVPSTQYSVLGTRYTDGSDSFRAVPNSPLTTDDLPLTSDHSPLTTHNSQLTALQSLIACAGTEHQPCVVTPDRVLEHDGRLVLLSRFVAGTPLTELLIRRGRFPADVVQAIGRQLISGLAGLESRKIVHGEIALWNVRLTSKGIATLVDAGIAPIVRPEILIDTEVSPERFDGVAPERVATGNPATAASEIYALGCLLWQLLAGRPPFPTGDPLTKLAHHQTRPVADVREWVPDCPDALAELLTDMTAFEPLARPASFAELTERTQLRDLRKPLGTGDGPARRRLRRFHASFRAAVPRIRIRPAGAGFVKRTLTACAVLAAAGVGVGLMDRDFRGPLLSIASPITERISALTQPEGKTDVRPKASTTAPHPATDSRTQPLPAPDAKGVIQLAPSGTYRWTKPLRSGRAIAIRGTPKKPAIVIAGTSSAFVSAPDVLLENVQVVVGAGTQAVGRNSSPLLAVQSDRLIVKRCGFHGAGTGTAIHWAARSTGSHATEVNLANTVIAGEAVAVRLAAVPSTLHCENVLHVGPGTLFRFDRLPPAGNTANVALVQVTQRNATALLRVDLPLGSGPFGRIAVSARNCVFHYAGNNAAMCVFSTSFPGQIPKGIVQFSGEGSLFPPGGRIAVEAAVGPESPARVDNEVVQVDGGLLACQFEFAGAAGNDPATSVIAKHRAPVRSQHRPGIDAGRLMPLRP